MRIACYECFYVCRNTKLHIAKGNSSLEPVSFAQSEELQVAKGRATATAAALKGGVPAGSVGNVCSGLLTTACRRRVYIKAMPRHIGCPWPYKFS
jgi:hypothetical protein